jgi:ERCC4-type nuclease
MTHYEHTPGAPRVEIAKPRTKVAPVLFRVIEDTRQQMVLPWPPGVVIERRTMPEADFTTQTLWGVAAIELKRDDFPAAVGSERERFDREIARLAAYRWKCIIVAQDITQVYRQTLVHPNALIGSVASWFARADVPTIFIGNDTGAARLICGILKRWEERVASENANDSGGQ